LLRRSFIEGGRAMVVGTTQGKQWTETLPTSRGAHFTGRTFFRLHALGEGLPTIGEIWATSDHAVDGHSHDADEMLYVLKGAIEVNGRAIGTNEFALIPAGSHYTARVTSDGGGHVLRIVFPHEASHDEPAEYDARPWEGPITHDGFPDLGGN
jgi:mannose-6-phosphate isomerase-like protein (cupin superfamily)